MIVVCETRTYMKVRDLERSCRMGCETGKHLQVHGVHQRRLYECECEWTQFRGSSARNAHMTRFREKLVPRYKTEFSEHAVCARSFERGAV